MLLSDLLSEPDEAQALKDKPTQFWTSFYLNPKLQTVSICYLFLLFTGQRSWMRR